LVIVVPITSVDRGWPDHVLIRGNASALAQLSFAMTERLRTISSRRIGADAGSADASTLAEVDQWLRDFIGP